MGLTLLNLDVADPAAPDRRETVELLVDSGAIYSFVPRSVLARLGIVPHGRQRFRLADGSTSSASATMRSSSTPDGAEPPRSSSASPATRRSSAR